MQGEKEKYALVTGASSGIGWHLSLELAARNYALVAVSKQEKELEDLKDHIQHHYRVAVETLCMDLAREDAAAALFRHCRQGGMEVEVLVNNAGMMIYGEMAGVAGERMKDMLVLHMHTPAMLCRHFGEAMQEAGKGYILNVSSISAVMPFPLISLYGPSKSFLRAFSRAIGTELGPRGVQVTCLMPGSTNTPLNAGDREVQAMSRMVGKAMEANVVAQKALRALFAGNREIIPGFLNKVLVNLLPLLPGGLIRMAYRRQVKQRKHA